MFTKEELDTAINIVRKVATVAKGATNSIIAQDLALLFPPLAIVLNDANIVENIALAATAAAPELEAVAAFFETFAEITNAGPNQDLDHVGPGRQEQRDGYDG